MKNILSAVLCAAISLIAGAETTTMATGPLSLDLRTGVRESDGSTEAISYDSSWFGGDGATATVSVSRNGEAAETLHSGTGAGTVDWTPTRPGLYTLTHETLQGGKTVGKTYTAQFRVPGIEYGVVFDANGGLGSMDPLDCTSRTPVTLPLCNFRRDGYDFSGWKNGSASYADGAEAGVLSETDGATVTLTAQWTKHVEDGCYVVIDVSGGPTADRYPVTFLDQVPEGGWTDEYKTEKIVLRKIPHGTFMMGQRETDYPGSINTNLHEVTLTKDLYAGVFEMTQKQWALVMGSNPSEFTGDRRPVERVSYDMIRGSDAGATWPASAAVDADCFMGVLRTKTGIEELDLPTEAQWEYACRAGTTTALNSGKNLSADSRELNEVARWVENSGYEPLGNTWIENGSWDGRGEYMRHAVVGTYLPNNWGLYDMHGNVWEWSLDWTSSSDIPATDPVGASSGDYRAIKGGSNNNSVGGCLSGSQGIHGWPSRILNSFGFRLFATIADNEAGLQVPYLVHFEPNGALGSMADMTCILGVATNLTQCQFRRDGYDFTGWSTNGTDIAFADGAAVCDLTSVGNTIVTLTAQWTKHVEDGCYVVIDVSGGTTVERYPVTFLNQVPEGGWSDEYKTEKIVLRKIPHGTFTMGSTLEYNNEPHSVTITVPVYIGVFEVTQKQYELVMGTNPSSHKGDKRAVECISYNMVCGESAGAGWPASSAVDASSFLGKIRSRAALASLDLPTEAQWEYACRAGTTSDYNNGGSTEADLQMLGRYSGNTNDGRGGYTGDGTTTVGSYMPNAWGLYDMHGNAYEWCRDWDGSGTPPSGSDPKGSASGSYRVLRGGGWRGDATGARSSYRDSRRSPSDGGNSSGFRLSATVADNEAGLQVPYLVHFEPNGALGSMEDMTCILGVATNLTQCQFRRDGYDFTGWSTNGTDIAFADGAAVCDLTSVGNTTVTLTAQWTKHVEDGCYVVIDVSGGPTAERYPVTFLNQVPEGGWTDEYKTTKIVLRKIPHGTFTMGRRETDYPGSVNTNLHEVTLTKDFYAGIFAITREQWQKIMGTVPTTYGGAMRPVTSVAWTDVRGGDVGTQWPTTSDVDADSLLGLLRAKTGIALDLPTSAQWEYSCRAGTTTALNNGKNLTSSHGICPNFNEVGRYYGNSGYRWMNDDVGVVEWGEWDGLGTYSRHCNVGSYLPNKYGLYDMHGNAWEWCLDWAGDNDLSPAVDPKGPETGSRRVSRGGNCYGPPAQSISGVKESHDPTTKSCGFRIFATVSDNEAGLLAPIVATVSGYEGTYDGLGHGVSVAVTAPASGAAVSYALAENGPYGPVAPLFTNACAATVWVKIEAPHYFASTNSATVKIVAPANQVWYVDATNGVDTALGTSWETAKKSIQAAIDAAVDGNTVLVTNGVYEAIHSDGKRIAIQSVEGAERTIIDGKRTARCAMLEADVFQPATRLATLVGFTLRNGVAPRVVVTNSQGQASNYGGGGGVYGGSVSHCIVRNNEASLKGGGGGASHAKLNRCILMDNLAGDDGGGAAACELDNCLVVGNTAMNEGGKRAGGGLASCQAFNCTITGNRAVLKDLSEPSSGGADSCKIYNCIVAGNTHMTGEPADISDTQPFQSVVGTRIWNRSDERIIGDPRFVDADHGDFRLKPDSPCVNAGNNEWVSAEFDLDGNPRLVGDRVDLGCYEVQTIEFTAEAFDVSIDPAEFVYDGTAKEPSATVTNAAAALVAGTDFSVSYENNVDAGTAKVIVTGKGVYVGALTNSFTIAKRPVTLTSDSATKTYDGMPLTKPSVTVSGDGFAAGEGATYSFTGSQTVAGSSANTFAYTLKDGTKAANYTIAQETGTLTVTRGTIGGDDDEPGEGDLPDGALSRFDAVRVFNGQTQSIDTNKLAAALAASLAGEYTVEYAPGAGADGLYEPASGWTTGVVGIRDVGEAVVWYRVTSPNYDPYSHPARVRVGPKTITDEMFVLSDDVFFYDGTEKKPSVTVKDGEPSICTAEDYTLEYGEKSGAGLTPVTVTGRRNYVGTVTKSFPIKKRPVASPVIGQMSYNGEVRTAPVPEDDRWTVVSNPGGVDVGSYTNVVLRLTAPENFCWKEDADETHEEWTFVFTITRAGNGWSRMPGLATNSWAYGEEPATLMMGQPRYGTTTEVTYRLCGANPETGSTTMPTQPGLYTVRFVVAETKNYAGTYKDIDFEITGGTQNDHTLTTPEPVPYTWLESCGLVGPGAAEAAYEEAAWAAAANGENAVWECYVAGLDPKDPKDRFLARIAMDASGAPVVTWTPDLRTAELPRAYTILGKETLGDAGWILVTDANRSRFRFFQVTVKIAK